MAEADEVPLIPVHTKRAAYALANLFLYSVAMFTLPFVAFFGMRHALMEYYHMQGFVVTAWSVIASVIVVNIIICVYAYQAYHEKEYDEQGNEIDQHSYQSADTAKSSLNSKED